MAWEPKVLLPRFKEWAPDPLQSDRIRYWNGVTFEDWTGDDGVPVGPEWREDPDGFNRYRFWNGEAYVYEVDGVPDVHGFLYRSTGKRFPSVVERQPYVPPPPAPQPSVTDRIHSTVQSARKHWEWIVFILVVFVLPAIVVIVMLITGYSTSGSNYDCNPPYDIAGCSGGG